MSNDTEFVNGLIVKAPHENAPEYVKGKLSIKNAELIEFLKARLDRGEEWTNVELKVSQGGKWYPAVDNWKPNQGGGSGGSKGGAPQRERPARATDPAPAGDFVDDDIPFATQHSRF